MKERCSEIDVSRGIAILLVIVGHCITDNYNPINRFILSFHMPLFFVISGLVAKARGEQKIWTFVKKMLFRIFPAQLSLGIIAFVYNNLVAGGGESFSGIYI